MLSNRLQTIFNIISDCDVLADIGTDHALLPIELIKEEKVKKVYAADIAIGPLENAKKNIKLNKMEDKIIPILSDGINDIPDDCDTVVVSGLGYHTCVDILQDNFERLYKFKQIVVQINKDSELLRRWISDHHFTIVDEEIVYEGLYYQVIVFNTNFSDGYSDLEINLGPILMKKNSKLFKEFLDFLLLKDKEIFAQIPKKNEKYYQLENNIKSLEWLTRNTK